MSPQVIFYVEGYSELEFVNEIIGPHLGDRGIAWHRPVLVANSVRKDRTARGGVRKYEPVRKDLLRLLGSYRGPDFVFTTMLDYYGLPAGFPAGKASGSGNATPSEKAFAIEAAWQEDLGDPRFIPNLLVHEYEALILARPESLLAAYPGAEKCIEALRRDIAGFANPEEIDDNPESSPSKRIIRAFEAHHMRYDKVTGGALAILDLGLETIRNNCPKFDGWLRKLESLSPMAIA
jgi:hypothetical protein